MKHPADLIATVLAVGLFAGCTAPDSDPNLTGTVDAPPNPFPIPASKTTVAGSGASFPALLISTWALEYALDEPNVQVSYQSVGSGQGIKDITAKVVVFGASDAPMTDAERAKTPNILHIPETLGVVGVVYSGGGLPDGLKLDGEAVGKIFTGGITKWNDPAIAALNPGTTLPDQTIKVMCRSDSSGTTFVFSDWMIKTSSAYRESQGVTPTKSTSAWACEGGRFRGNENVAPNVKNSDFAIGYVEYAYIKQQELKSAAIKNKAGEFVAISTEAGQKAAAGVASSLPAADGDWSDVSIVDPEGAGAYPIASFSYILVYENLVDYEGRISANELNAFRAWLWWAIHEGQAYSDSLGYAPLPAEVAALGENALQGIQV